MHDITRFCFCAYPHCPCLSLFLTWRFSFSIFPISTPPDQNLLQNVHDRFLAKQRPSVPFSFVQKLIRNKKVRILVVGGSAWSKVSDPSTRVNEGDMLHIHSQTYADEAMQSELYDAPRLMVTEREATNLR